MLGMGRGARPPSARTTAIKASWQVPDIPGEVTEAGIPEPRMGNNDLATCYTTEKAGALLGGLLQKGQIYYTVKTSPNKPKANTTMTVKVNIFNAGGADGFVGRVDIFTTPLAAVFPFFSPDDRCDRTDFSYSFNTTNLVIKAGKSKTVTIKDVPVPSKAGWSGLVVLPDAGCANEAEKTLVWQAMPFIRFEVAP
ncbi:hypothetical protein Rsub_03513 [Raphidocelis subcapitata]|uniref:Uncharacterized protein n=1 Tax=Raphidocelis subcapitata TaxID=307507 RepID=A0A2V0P013_9CHLO|nr:hypothetical protein Rsub_03513 [Raphidocelis subcapitata]|eukprot:GBF90517.1 hypothetical protein Rsub_03513 [Raphidocelis subcapitata]